MGGVVSRLHTPLIVLLFCQVVITRLHDEAFELLAKAFVCRGRATLERR